MKNFARFLVLTTLFLGQLGFSQTCCSGGVPLSNNLGLPNDGKGTLLLGLSYDYNNLNTLNAGSSELDDDSRLRVTNSVLLSIGYSFSDRLSIESLITWVNQLRTITQFGNETDTETNGIGDAVFLVKYAFPNLLGQRSTVSFGAGAKAPLGKSNLTTSQGIQLTADLQPGSGAWDFIGLVSISKGLNFRPSATLSGSFTYRETGINEEYLNNTATYEFGNEMQVNLGYTDQFGLFNTIFNPGLIIKYRKAQVDIIDESDLPNTGGEWIFIRPELSANISQNLVLVSRFELPLYSYVDGTQLTPTNRFTIGLLWKLQKKKIGVLN
ncbi:transporter [Flagellimonas sp. S3867]|uniref:transporter n=1 Tax=Flagellimonas sp. S3867 TaxID=2768063 RepID=UPI00168A23C1|nr:transporter [Flagellimonas sp. S3867]